MSSSDPLPNNAQSSADQPDVTTRQNEWFPWTEASGNPPAATNAGLPIMEPPCKNCKRFLPQVTFRNTPEGQKPDGVRLCHADDMHNDFSCFKKKDEPIKATSS